MLTQKQYELARFIDRYIREKGYGPSFAEMAAATKTNVSLVHVRVCALESHGVIRRELRTPRGIKMRRPAVFFAPPGAAAA